MRPGWINYFMNTINATFPHRDHVLINNGAPGTNLQFAATSSCLESRTPKSVCIMHAGTVSDMYCIPCSLFCAHALHIAFIFYWSSLDPVYKQKLPDIPTTVFIN